MTLVVIATLTTWLLSAWCVISAFSLRGFVRKVRRLLIAALWAGVGALVTAVLVLLQLCHAFSGETLIARVTARRLTPTEFELVYTPADARGGAITRARLRGDQWSISGGIVKWHPWLTTLGVKSYHKAIRLSGQFSNLEPHRAHRPTVCALEPGADHFWEGVYWASRYLPFIEAVYGSSAYVYVEPQSVQEVYVTPSGYLIKRTRRP